MLLYICRRLNVFSFSCIVIEKLLLLFRNDMCTAVFCVIFYSMCAKWRIILKISMRVYIPLLIKPIVRKEQSRHRDCLSMECFCAAVQCSEMRTFCPRGRLFIFAATWIKATSCCATSILLPTWCVWRRQLRLCCCHFRTKTNSTSANGDDGPQLAGNSIRIHKQTGRPTAGRGSDVPLSQHCDLPPSCCYSYLTG